MGTTQHMDGDSTEAEIWGKRWYENANEISAFLSSINPYWSKEAWQDMFYEHLELITSQVISLINKNYKAAVKSQDLLEIGTLKMANRMYKGIIKQFPCDFGAF